MPFDGTYLTLVGPSGNSNAGRMWRYITEDALATINTTGYFNTAFDLLDVTDSIQYVQVGDLTADPLTVSSAGTFIVLSNASEVVDVSDGEVILVTDTD